MDQDFAPQGFSAHDAASIERRLAGRAPGELEIAGKTASTATRGGARAGGAQEKVAQLEKSHSLFMLPVNWQFFGGLASGIVGWATGKLGLQRTTAVIKMIAHAPVKALRTAINEWGQIPANFFKAAGEEATNAGEKATGLANSASAAEQVMAKHGRTVQASLGQFFAPLVKFLGAGITRLEESSAGKGLRKLFGRVVENRKAAALRRHAAALDNVNTALTSEGASGFGSSIRHFFSHTVMRKPVPGVEVGELSSIMRGVNSAKADPRALKTLAGTLENMIAGGKLSAEASSRAGNVAKHLSKLIGSAHAVETYGAASGGSLKTMAKAMARSLGRVSVFSGLISVGIAFGVGSTLVAANAESKESKAALADLKNQLGQSDSGFLEAMQSMHKKQGLWGATKTGLKLAGNVANDAMWLLPGGGGMAMMTAGFLPALCENLVPGNPSLGAFVVIGKDDAGELKLERGARIQAVRNLVAVMPAVAAKGGFYNHLAQPIATEIVDRNLTQAQIVQLFGSNAAFTQLSREVAEKLSQKSAAQAKVTVANDNDKIHPAAEKAQAAMSSAEAAYHQAAKPMSKVAADDLQLEGKAAGAQLQVG